MTKKNYFHFWQDYVKKLLNVTPVPIAETKLQKANRMSILEADPEKWFKYYFPTESAEPAPFHKAATKRILENPEWYEVRLWSRELAKSTRTMMEVLYLTLVGHPTPNHACHPELREGPYTSTPRNNPSHETSAHPNGAKFHSDGHRPSNHDAPNTPTLRDRADINVPLAFRESLSRPSCRRLGVRSKQHVLLISSSLDNAARLLIPYKANLELNPRIVNDYGTQHNYGKWTSTEFTTRKGVSFRAVGAGQPPRGAKNENNVRPDVILFDDIDTDTDCRNPEMINKTWKWIEEAAISTRSVANPTTIIFCGNRIAVDCCVVRACSFADHVDEINIVDAGGNPSWPQKNTKQHIERVLKQKSYASAQKEYFNNPITEGAVFKQMNYKPMQPLNDYKMLICYTDPSYKDGTKNDYKATVLVGKYHEEFHIIKCFVEQTSTAQMIDWHYQIINYLTQSPVIARNEATLRQPSCHLERSERPCHPEHREETQQHEPRNMSPFRDGVEQQAPQPTALRSSLSLSPYFYMEEVLLQDLILDEFYKEGRKRGHTIPIQGDQRRKGHKYTRIEALLEPLHRNNLLYLNEAEKNNPHMKRLNEQFLAFAPGSRAHDDAPDAVEGAIWLINHKTTAAAASTKITIIPRKPNSKRF